MTPTRFVIAVGALLWTGVAHADGGVGERGTFAIGIDRLFGLAASTVTVHNNGNESSATTTELGLLMARPASLYMWPRLALDYAVIDGLTVGGAVAVVVGDSSTEQNNVGRDGPTRTGFLFAPRAGFAKGLTGSLGLWLRGGITWFRVEGDGFFRQGSVSASGHTTGLSLNLEPGLSIMATGNLGLTVTLIADIPLMGEQVAEINAGNSRLTSSTDERLRNLGVVVGALGRF